MNTNFAMLWSEKDFVNKVEWKNLLAYIAIFKVGVAMYQNYRSYK